MCYTPYCVRDKKTGDTQPVPCGKCPKCVSRRTSQWSFRLMEEEKVSDTAHFITLTYDTRHVPITRKGYMSLNKDDIRLFWARLRKRHKKRAGCKPVRYYCVGEYGGKTNRPHFHAIVFNAVPEDISASWQLGHTHYGGVTGASIGYTLKYMCKRRRFPLHQNDDRVPEFGTMSKGLGKSYLTEAKRRWHLAGVATVHSGDSRMYCVLSDGTARKITMPRYYKDKIYTDVQRKAINVVVTRDRIKAELEEQRRSGQNYFRDKAEKVKAAFAHMYKKYDENQKI